MARKKDAIYRHAKFYAEILKHAHRQYCQGGGNVFQALEFFDINWENIKLGFRDLTRNILQNQQQLAILSCHYSIYGYTFLRLRADDDLRLRWAKQGLAASRKIKNKKLEIEFLADCGLIHYSLGNLDKAIEHYNKALRILKKQGGNPEKQARILGNLAGAYLKAHNFDTALVKYQDALRIVRGIESESLECSCLGGLAVVYRNMGDHNRAIELLTDQNRIAKVIGNVRLERDALGNLGAVYIDLHLFDKAIDYYNQALAISHDIKDLKGQIQDLSNLINAYEASSCPDKANEAKVIKAELEIRLAENVARIV